MASLVAARTTAGCIRNGEYASRHRTNAEPVNGRREARRTRGEKIRYAEVSR
jgi:hypothetical protein